MRNKKGQFQVIGIFLQVLVVLFLWSSGLASQINWWTQRAIEINGLDGMTAFLLAYMNLWILLGLMLVVSIGANMLGGGE